MIISVSNMTLLFSYAGLNFRAELLEAWLALTIG